jgi:hypothetical protein
VLVAARWPVASVLVGARWHVASLPVGGARWPVVQLLVVARGRPAGYRSKDRIDFAAGAGAKDLHLQPHGATSQLHCF